MNAGAPSNPFSTRFHAPGRLPFVFEAVRGADSTEAFWDAFQSAGRRGEIAGPHGTGKTTLLRALEAPARSRGWTLRTLTLRDGQRRLPPGWREDLEPGAIVIVDGAEQLGWFQRLGLRWACRRNEWGLLVTTHAPLGGPVLYRTAVHEKLAEALVDQVLAQSPQASRLVEAAEAREALAATAGNMREALSWLYDLYEGRWARKGTRGCAPGK